MSGPLQRLRANATQVVSTLVTGIWLAALFTGQDWWLPFLLVGYVVVVPMTALLFGDREDIQEWWDNEDVAPERATAQDDTADPLQTLKQRYARGELTDDEFEHKLERLLETDELDSTDAAALDSLDLEHSSVSDERELDRE